MTIARALARSNMAPMFILGGLDSFRHPDERAKLADPVTSRISSALGIEHDAVRLVKINGAVQVVAGSLLAVGRFRRLAAAALATSLVPTTLAGHRYWDESDPQIRVQQRTQFLKNMAMLGGLAFAATDTNGAPSLTWRTKRAASHAKRRTLDTVNDAVHALSSHDRVSPTDALAEQGTRLASAVGDAVSSIGDHAKHVADQVASAGASAGHRIAAKATELST